MNSTAGIVLCGGRSSRMGQSKAQVIWDGAPLVARAVQTVESVGSPILVAAAPDQELPDLPSAAVVVRDPAEHQGPLAAFASAVSRLPVHVDAVLLIGCDMPFFTAAIARFIVSRLGPADAAAVPFIAGRWHPLAAIYRTSVRTNAKTLLAGGKRRMIDLIESVAVRAITEDELRQVDPGLNALRNVNTPEELASALRDAGRSPTVSAT